MARETLRLVEEPDGSRPEASGEDAGSARPGEAEAGPPPGWLTIDAVARETRMTVRNIRAHQARSLVPPPLVRQRTGYYGPDHLARIQLIQELQGDGFNLKGIERLLDETHGPAERLLGIKRLAMAPFETEAPQVFTRKDLTQRFGTLASARNLKKAKALGVLVPVGNGAYEAPSPSLLDAAEEVVARGVPMESALRTITAVRRHCEEAGRAFVQMFIDEVWRPFERAGMPEDRWEEISDSIERLRPLASQATMALFQQTMTSEVEKAFGREVDRLARGTRGKRER